MLAVVRDWKLNSRVLEFPKFSATDDETLSEKLPYPEFYSGSLNSAISSGVFRSDNDSDSETLKIICAYNISLTKLQNKLDLADETLFVGLGRNPLEKFRQIRRSYELALFKKSHDRLGEVLKRDGWLAQEGFFKVSDRIGALRKLHEKVAVIFDHDPNSPHETFVLSIDDWRIFREWYSKIYDILEPGGYFESEVLLHEDSAQKLRIEHERFGEILDQISSSDGSTIILDKGIYQTIIRWHDKVTTLMEYDRWVTRELDLLH